MIVLRMLSAAVILSVITMSAGCAKHPAGQAAPSLSPKQERSIVVAKVNGAPINQYSLGNMTWRMSEVNKQSSPPDTPEQVRKKALDQLIFRELAYQEAVRRGMRVEDQRVDAEMEKFITSVGHAEGYEHYLAAEELTPVEVRAEVERAFLLQDIMKVEVADKVKVTGDDLQKEYERLKPQLITPERIMASEIVFSPVKQETAGKAEEIRRAVNAGKDRSFKDLVSDGTYTVRSGLLDKDKEPEIYDAARKLKEGEVSEVIKAGEALYIVRVDSITPEKQMTFEQVERKLKQKLLTERRLARFQEWQQELNKDAAIEILDPSLK